MCLTSFSGQRQGSGNETSIQTHSHATSLMYMYWDVGMSSVPKHIPRSLPSMRYVSTLIPRTSINGMGSGNEASVTLLPTYSIALADRIHTLDKTAVTT